MADVTTLGPQTVVAAADIANASHPINQNASSQYNGQAGVSKVVGQFYIRQNSATDFDIVMPLANGTWSVLDGSGTVVTPA